MIRWPDDNMTRWPKQHTWKRYEGANESNEEEKKLSLRQCKTHRGLQKRVNLLLHEATKDCINILQVNHSTIVQISFSNLLLDIDRPSGKVDAGQFLVTSLQSCSNTPETALVNSSWSGLISNCIGLGKNWYRKKYQYQYQNFWVSKKKYRFWKICYKTVSDWKKIGDSIGKSFGFGFVKIFGFATHWTRSGKTKTEYQYYR